MNDIVSLNASPALVRLLGVLNSPRNRSVIAALTESAVTTGDLERRLGMAQPTLCRALNDLRAVGLATATAMTRGNPGRPKDAWVRTEPLAAESLAQFDTIARTLVERRHERDHG